MSASVADELSWTSNVNADPVYPSTIEPSPCRDSVHDHEGTLIGSAPWNYQRVAAARIMESLPGVYSVQNDSHVVPELPFAAVTAKQNIRAALTPNAQIEADPIHVHADGTEIDLTGKVRTWAERRQASRIAWNTPGVTNVDNKL